MTKALRKILMDAVDTYDSVQLDKLLKDINGQDLDFNIGFFSPLSKSAYRGPL